MPQHTGKLWELCKENRDNDEVLQIAGTTTDFIYHQTSLQLHAIQALQNTVKQISVPHCDATQQNFTRDISNWLIGAAIKIYASIGKNDFYLLHGITVCD